MHCKLKAPSCSFEHEGAFEHEGSLFQLYVHFDRVVVGEDEALIKGVHGEKLHIGGDDKSVNEIVLRGFVIRVIGLIVQAAGRHGVVIYEAPALGQKLLLQNAGNPQGGILHRIFFKGAGEGLIEVAAGDYIVALFVFRLQKFTKHFCLGGLALAVVVGFEVQVHYNELGVGSLNVTVADKQAALEVRHTNRPAKGAGKGNAFRSGDFVVGNRHKAAVHLADGGQGERNVGAGIVQGVGGGALCAGEVVFPLVNAVGTLGIGVNLLQKADVGTGGSDNFAHSVKVFANGGFVAGGGVFTAVHEEICLLAKPCIAGVEAEQLYIFLLGEGLCRLEIIGFRLLDGGGLVLGDGKPADEHDGENEHGGDEHAEHLQNFFEHDNSPVKTAAPSRGTKPSAC